MSRRSDSRRFSVDMPPDAAPPPPSQRRPDLIYTSARRGRISTSAPPTPIPSLYHCYHCDNAAGRGGRVGCDSLIGPVSSAAAAAQLDFTTSPQPSVSVPATAGLGGRRSWLSSHESAESVCNVPLPCITAVRQQVVNLPSSSVQSQCYLPS